MTTKPGWALSINIFTEDTGHVVKASEVFARAAAGLALDGLQVSVTISTIEIEEDEE